jgi:uncharacterized protein
MKFPKYTFDEVSLIELIKSFGINELYIFGSVLREDFDSSSDIDLIVRISKDRHYSLFDIMDIKEKLEQFFERDVDLIEFDSLRNPFRKNEILRTAKKIYAA